MQDMLVREVHRGAWKFAHATPVRSTSRGRLQNSSMMEWKCGGVHAVKQLSAPLFMAAETPHNLAQNKVPFGFRMDEQVVHLASIKRYQRNTSQPRKCHFNTCAVVGSSSSLRGQSFGKAIDAHEAVFRVNAAPTAGHAEAVGTKTTHRVQNSEKPFMLASLGVPELQLVICHMRWLGECQQNAFSGNYLDQLVYVNPVFYVQLWTLLGHPKDKKIPSTGLLAIALALGLCSHVTHFGFGRASVSSHRQCRHYWECVASEDAAAYSDPLHPFHDWIAEDYLRDLWTRSGLIIDGEKSGKKGRVGPEARGQKFASDNSPLLHGSRASQRWEAMQSEREAALDALQKARMEHRHIWRSGKVPFNASNVDMLTKLMRRGGGSKQGAGMRLS
eukprot:CAMPEP_0119347238 /NCGR_PEP_ID=MMETSP1333-20130426/108419_1 /TAXON_ID=418940 /ORGANISM="Scyphosphaera apsteinii, Strain RCC1455" /LENGTH=387 /DNA_ID=CAMNT_0007359771 /DNA_START=267 /DNA_END=1430 /DNA_ORIENTATION=+